MDNCLSSSEVSEKRDFRPNPCLEALTLRTNCSKDLRVQDDGYDNFYATGVPLEQGADKFEQSRAQSNLEAFKAEYQLMDSEMESRLTQMLNTIRSVIKTDPRAEHRVMYPLDTTTFIIVLAKLCGNNTGKQISEFYRKHLYQLQCILPGLPPPNHILNACTVNKIINIITPEEIQKLVQQFAMADVSFFFEQCALNQQRSRPSGILPTLGFDGQWANDSFVRGKFSRIYKAIVNVTLFNCTLKKALDSIPTEAKNHESKAFLTMLERSWMFVLDTIIMADALNTKPEVSAAILRFGAHFLLNIKNNGYKAVISHFKGVFNREYAKQELSAIIKKESIEKGHGRIEHLVVEVLPASLLDKRISCKHEQVNSVARCTKTISTLRNGNVVETSTTTRYYICSLPFSEQTAEQILWSILDYWSIEQHHSRLDDPRVFDQDAVQSNRVSYLGNMHCINKIAYNIVFWYRIQQCINSGSTYILSFRDALKKLNDKPLFSLIKLVTDYCEQDQSVVV